MLWSASHRFYYALPRLFLQVMLLPLCYHTLRATFNTFLEQFHSTLL